MLQFIEYNHRKGCFQAIIYMHAHGNQAQRKVTQIPKVEGFQRWFTLNLDKRTYCWIPSLPWKHCLGHFRENNDGIWRWSGVDHVHVILKQVGNSPLPQLPPEFSWIAPGNSWRSTSVGTLRQLLQRQGDDAWTAKESGFVHKGTISNTKPAASSCRMP